MSCVSIFLLALSLFQARFSAFFGYVAIDGNQLTPDVAFVALMFFAMLRQVIYQIPQMITSASQALVSGRRIVSFLNGEELDWKRYSRGHITSDEAEEIGERSLFQSKRTVYFSSYQGLRFHVGFQVRRATNQAAEGHLVLRSQRRTNRRHWARWQRKIFSTFGYRW